MTEKLTWTEFVEKYKPKDYEKFLDDRGNEWTYLISRESFVSNDAVICVRNDKPGHILTCPLIPPKKKRKMWFAMVIDDYHEEGDGYDVKLSSLLYDSEEDARKVEGEDFLFWPAIPGPDGSYEVPE